MKKTGAAKTVEELAALVSGRVVGDGSLAIVDLANIGEASGQDLVFVSARKFLGSVKASSAGAVIVSGAMEGDSAFEGKTLIVVDDPQLAFAIILDELRPTCHPSPGLDDAAVVKADATIGEGVSIGACAVIEEGAVIGAGTVIYPGVYVGVDSSVGEDSVLYSNVSVREGCHVGSRVTIHPNSVIGSDGFGYVYTGGKYKKIPQRGSVTICDDVEIGACVAVDRATIGVTTIGRGTKIDNLVQIAHNVSVGEDAVIVSQVGISGSTTIGDRVRIGGQVGIVGHLTLGDDCAVGAQSGVSCDIAPGEVLSGTPAIPHTTWLRSMGVVKKLPDMKRRLDSIDKRLKALEGDGEG